jgi:CRISPR system Cascade subunit CasA
MTSFDLIHQSWVPVTISGRRAEVSLLEALTMAHEIDGLALDDPLQAVAVLRQVLLPVTLDAIGAPRSRSEWAGRWQEGRLDAGQLSDYLAEHANRFDLFHPVTPFAQVAGLRTEKHETKPVTLVLPAIASGNNVPLFSARTEADPPTLTCAHAARALLAAHCWDTAAIKSGAVGDPQVKAGKTTGNPTGALGQLGVTVPFGRSLAETLLLNIPIISAGLRPDDRPQWRSRAATSAWRQRPVLGLLDLLTWQSRRIRLVPEELNDGEIGVRHVVLGAGDRLDQIPVDVEQHTAWRQVDKPKAGDPPTRPVRHQPGRSAWQGLGALLATTQPTDNKISSPLMLRQLAGLREEEYLPADLPLQVLTVGVAYGNQSAVIEDVLVDQIPLPVAALAAASPVRQLLLDVVGQADDLRAAANHLGDDLRRAAGGDKIPWDKSQRLGDILVYDFTPVVRRMLAGLQRHPEQVDKADSAWRAAARRIALEAAEPALAAAPPEAFLGRQEREGFAHRLSTAEARYRAAVNRALGSARDNSDDQVPEKAGA